MKPIFRPTIIALVGHSGTGKTHLSNFLKQRLGIPVIVSYTTRPRRENEKDGRDYYFIREEQIPPVQQMLTYTEYGGCEYFARLDQVPRMGRCVYVVDEKGLLSLKEKYKGCYDIVSVLLRSTPKALEARGISAGRISRDAERLELPDSFYDAVIENNGTLSDFEERALHIINQFG